MRKYQVSITVNCFEQPPAEIHKIHVYADADNFYEAVGDAVKNVYETYQIYNGEPTICVNTSYDEIEIYSK